jgi:spermidine/putrescine transport system permease protein
MTKKKSILRFLVTFPIIVYSLTLILIPILYVLFLSFCKSDSFGGIEYAVTLENYKMIFDAIYIKILLKSFLIGLITTIICICISYPFSIFLMDKSETKRNLLIKLVMIPFLTNSLIRTYGWIVLLRKSGVINTALTGMHITNGPLNLMYNTGGIIVGMVYTLLPFMILPVYSAISKMDWKLTEAAKDLGANKFHTFTKVIVPETIAGVFNGSLMVFIPAIGYFFISDILGGGKIMIIGNLIKNQFLTARNWPFGAAISIFLILLTFLLIKIYKKLGGKLDELGGF